MKVENWDKEILYAYCCDWIGIKSKKYKKLYIKGIKICTIADPKHILCGERGIFAEKNFEIGDIVGQYTGKIVPHSVCGKYVASLSNTEEDLGIDAVNSGNELRYVNDYRKIQSEPNCKLSSTFVDGKPVVLVCVIKHINVQDELLLNYGEEYWSFLQNG